MATVSDIDKPPLSGYNWIDALIDNGPHWNFLTPGSNTIYFTFSVSANNETGNTDIDAATRTAFSATQQANARLAMAYLSQVTGILFVETTDTAKAQVHLCNVDILGDPQTAGLCSWGTSYRYLQGSNELTEYTAQAYVYLDNKEWASQNATLTQGSQGYETLLHELGHMLGLKHPFQGNSLNPAVLPSAQDNTSLTLMAYTDSGGPYTSFRPYDLAALNWLYGGDGLGGALGIGSSTGARYLSGSASADTLSGTGADDVLEGMGGNDVLQGGAGSDTAVYSGLRSAYTIQSTNGTVTISGGTEGTDTLVSVERLRFSDGSFLLSALLNIDTTPPDAPSLKATLNANGYAKGGSVSLSGTAEAKSSVQVFSGSTLLGTATADANGAWSLTTAKLGDGSYSLTAKASDAAGNVSAASSALAVKIDTSAPAAPTITVGKDASGLITGNQPLFSGAGEAGATVKLYQGSIEIASTSVASNGTWSVTAAPQANGKYDVVATQTDAAENASGNSSVISFSVSSSLNSKATSSNDLIVAQSGNNNVDGGAGIDVLQFSGARANYTVQRTANGYLVTDKVGNGGTDLLQNVERLQFSDAWLAIDIDGIGGQIYRIYQAVFGRAPDKGGAGYWMARLADSNLKEIAAGFMTFPEFADKFGGATPSDEVFVTKLYNNVLNRAPDTEGYNFWMGILKQGHARADVLIAFSEFPENYGNAITLIGNGYEYTPFP